MKNVCSSVSVVSKYFFFLVPALDSGGGFFCSQLISTEDYQLECFGHDSGGSILEGCLADSSGDDANFGTQLGRRNLGTAEAVQELDSKAKEPASEASKTTISKKELTLEVTRIYQLIKVSLVYVSLTLLFMSFLTCCHFAESLEKY